MMTCRTCRLELNDNGFEYADSTQVHRAARCNEVLRAQRDKAEETIRKAWSLLTGWDAARITSGSHKAAEDPCEALLVAARAAQADQNEIISLRLKKADAIHAKAVAVRSDAAADVLTVMAGEKAALRDLVLVREKLADAHVMLEEVNEHRAELVTQLAQCEIEREAARNTSVGGFWHGQYRAEQERRELAEKRERNAQIAIDAVRETLPESLSSAAEAWRAQAREASAKGYAQTQAACEGIARGIFIAQDIVVAALGAMNAEESEEKP